MIVEQINRPDSYSGFSEPTAVTMGNFDGLHLGHQTLLRSTLDFARELDLQSAALTFSPHPEEFFLRHDRHEERLFTLEQKIRAMNEYGLDALFIQDFTELIAAMSPERFLQEYVVGKLSARAITVGENFRFGHQRAGDSQFLKDFAASNKIQAAVLGASLHENEVISSTRIRRALAHHGSVKEAHEMLGRPYLVEGRISLGDQLGRKIGFPTVNLSGIDQLIPANGVYAGWVWVKNRSTKNAPLITKFDRELMLAVINIGNRPTVRPQESTLRVEAHIIDEVIGDNELYDQKCGIFFVQRLRPEMAFPGIEELKKAILKDKEKTQSLRQELIF